LQAKNGTLIVIIGPTAVGKTATSIRLAQKLNAEILSADSRQFFKEISIGTAKPTPEEQAAVKHHFIDNRSIREDYNASDFEKEVLSFLSDYFEKKKTAILCGGSGMYIDAVCKGFDTEVPTSDPSIRAKLNENFENGGIESLQEQLKKLDPEFYQEIDLNNSKRLLRAIEVCLISDKKYSEIRKGKVAERPFNQLKIGLNIERSNLYDRINQRVDIMIEEGLIEEARSVFQYRNHNALKTVGYRELFNYFDKKCSLEEAIEKIKVNSRRYAKRQLTWFKRDDSIKWFAPSQDEEILQYIRNNL
jgi:tRNA dimethylallyltransferase